MKRDKENIQKTVSLGFINGKSSNEQLHLYKSILKQVKDYIILYIPETCKIVDFNHAVEKLIKQKPNNQLLSDIFNNEFCNSLRKAEPDSEIEFKLSKNKYLSVRKNIINHNTSNIGVIILKDITKNKEAELIQKKYANSLEHEVKTRTSDLSLANQILQREILAKRKTEEKLQTIFLNIHQPFIILDKSHIVVLFNESVKKLAKEYFKIDVKTNINLSKLFSKARYRTFNSHIQKAFKGEVVGFEALVGRKGQKKIWIEFNFAPVFDKNKNIKEVFINPIDITDRKSSQEEMIQTIEKERELNKLRTQFIATASHEFRTPLANILLNTQLIERFGEGWEKEKTDEKYKRIYDSIKGITNMLDDISMLGKEQSGQLRYNPSIFNLPEFIDQIRKEIKSTHLKFVEIDLNYDKTITEVKGDKNLLRQILVNILNNAVKYASKNPLILLTVSKGIKSIEFRVIDNGIGIPANDFDSIFEPFQRGSNTEKIGGSGLGLSIVRTCLDLHNGNYSITSKENRGTSFWFSIPV
jgi:PAS domain S-box-containing protein